MKGRKHSEETKRKISENNGSKREDVRKYLHLFGKHLSDEYKIKISNFLKGRFVSDETRLKMSENNYNKGKHLSKEIREKLSTSLIKMYSINKVSEETKIKMSLSKKGDKHPMFVVRSILERLKLKYLDIVLVKSILKKLRKKCLRLEKQLMQRKDYLYETCNSL